MKRLVFGRLKRVGDVGEIGQIHAVVLRLRGDCRLLIRLEVAVAGKAAAGGNELADDDVLLQADEVVDLALDGGIGQHLRGLLEGRGRQEALRGERRLRDAHKDMLSRRGRELSLPCRDALGDRAVGRAELMQIHNGAGQQVRAAGMEMKDVMTDIIENKFKD